LNYSEKKRYVGNLAQLAEAKEYRLCGGRAEGIRAVDVKNGEGLDFTVIADRCMDISQLSYKGYNFCFISPCGVVAPQYYDNRGIEFLRSFTAGFLTTCGLTAAGSPCTDDGQELGLHGRISNIPAENFSCATQIIEDNPAIRIKGTMKQARLFGENLTLTREIVCGGGINRIEIIDEIENSGYQQAPFMMIYHFNLGYPLLDENAVILIPAKSTIPRNEHAASALDQCMSFQNPQDDFEEMCYYHDLACDSKGQTVVGLYNTALRLGVKIRFDKNILDHFIEWKMMAPGEYVLGLEPSNCHADGRDVERHEGRLRFINAGEKKTIKFVIEIIDGENDLSNLKKEIEMMSLHFKNTI
jgi:hypothetical protein